MHFSDMEKMGARGSRFGEEFQDPLWDTAGLRVVLRGERQGGLEGPLRRLSDSSRRGRWWCGLGRAGGEERTQESGALFWRWNHRD